jgi:ABC-2 type transport system ATP-binding protein
MTVAQLDRVSKSFGTSLALDRACFSVREGEVVALLGRNGAGKSTALSILIGLRRPDTGAARLFGGDPRSRESRCALGTAPQESVFPATLRVAEILDLVRAHYERPLPSSTLYERFGLDRLADRQAGGLSGGERRRVGVALAFAGRPLLAVLDEPTAGLDAEARASVWAAIRSQSSTGRSVLLTTHHLTEADALADRVVLLEGGTVVADGSVKDVKEAAGGTLVRFRAAPAAYQDSPELKGARRDGDYLSIVTPDGGALVTRLVAAGLALDDLEVRRLTLEEALGSQEAAL